jgi:hypothetical protein
VFSQRGRRARSGHRCGSGRRQPRVWWPSGDGGRRSADSCPSDPLPAPPSLSMTWPAGHGTPARYPARVPNRPPSVTNAVTCIAAPSEARPPPERRPAPDVLSEVLGGAEKPGPGRDTRSRPGCVREGRPTRESAHRHLKFRPHPKRPRALGRARKHHGPPERVYPRGRPARPAAGHHSPGGLPAARHQLSTTAAPPLLPTDHGPLRDGLCQTPGPVPSQAPEHRGGAVPGLRRLHQGYRQDPVHEGGLQDRVLPAVLLQGVPPVPVVLAEADPALWRVCGRAPPAPPPASMAGEGQIVFTFPPGSCGYSSAWTASCLAR